jgi:hypothetical protein
VMFMKQCVIHMSFLSTFSGPTKIFSIPGLYSGCLGFKSRIGD